MKEYNRNTKILVITALVIAVIGLSLGFAAFTRTLTIQSAADVKPDQTEFTSKIKFVTKDGNGSTVAATNMVGGASGAQATLSATQISGIKAHFTKPGQSLTYEFKVKNESTYDAYLNSINFSGTPIACTGVTTGNIPDKALVQAACQGISVSVTVGDGDGKAMATNSSNPEIDDHILTKTTGTENVVVKIEYKSNSAVADGDFNVTIGDITLTYGTQDH